MWSTWLAWRCERFAFWGLKCSGCGSQNGWRVDACARRSCSYVAAVSCRDCGSQYFLKKIRTADRAADCGALREYQVLESLTHGYVKAPDFMTPQVYGFCASTCSYSMQLLVGEPLDKRLRTSPNKSVFNDCLQLAASWLRELHHLKLECEPGKNFVQMMQEIDTACTSLATENHWAYQGIELLRYTLAEIDRAPVWLVPLHGDFKASNLIRTSAGVYGIDIGLNYKNAGTMDAAKFIADLMLNRRDINVIRKYHEVTDTVQVFMTAYGDNSLTSQSQISWWLLYFLLSWWKRERNGWKPALLVDRVYTRAIQEAISYSKAINRL